jgi:hypothetical protein
VQVKDKKGQPIQPLKEKQGTTIIYASKASPEH